MGNVNLSSINWPLSGAVTQTFSPWTNYLTVNLGQSSDDSLEKNVLADVASYGKQLGRIGDALIVLLRHVALPPEEQLPDAERRALSDLREMLHRIADVKDKHQASLVLRPK